MRKALALTFFFSFLPFLAFAQNEAQSLASCFDYYKFQSVEIDLHGEKQIYKAGEGAKFIGSLTNKNSYPLVGGSLILRISKLDPRSQVGNDIIDEWVAMENINLRAGERQLMSSPYQLPSGLPTGTYVLNSYFLTQDKFNISGLSFTDDIYGGYATFAVEGKSERSIKFDRTGVKADGKPYRIFGFIPNIFSKDTKSVRLEVPLRNNSSKSLKAGVAYEIYYWDAADKDNLIESRNEIAMLGAGQAKTLSLDVDVSGGPVHFIKIKAEAEDQKSEIHIRLIKEGFKPRLNFVGLSSFPLSGGSSAVAFACYHNTTEGEGVGKLDIALKTSSGRTLAEAETNGKMTGTIDLLSKDVSRLRGYDKLTLLAELKDASGAVVDSAEVTYDCSKFSESICLKSRVNFYTLLAGVVILIIALYFLKKHFSNKGEQPVV